MPTSFYNSDPLLTDQQLISLSLSLSPTSTHLGRMGWAGARGGPSRGLDEMRLLWKEGHLLSSHPRWVPPPLPGGSPGPILEWEDRESELSNLLFFFCFCFVFFCFFLGGVCFCFLFFELELLVRCSSFTKLRHGTYGCSVGNFVSGCSCYCCCSPRVGVKC